MPAQIADLRAKVSLEGADKAKKDLAELRGGTGGGGIMGLADSFKQGLGAVTGFMAGFAGFQIAGDAVGFVKDQLLDVLQAGMDQQKVMAQTSAVIKSTGGAAHISASQVGELSDHMAQLTGISDDQVQSMVNVLLTFTNLKGNIPQVTQTVLDVATAMHEDLQSAAVQVGKALNDPATGMTALQRIGVTFTQSQKDAAAQMEKTGNMAGAQAIVLKELTKEFGGSAKAAGETLPGQLARLNVSFDQAKEKIALAVIPTIQKLVDQYIMPLADWLGAHLPAAIQATTNFLDNVLVPSINKFMSSPMVQTIEGWAQALATKLDPQLSQKTPTAADTTVKAFKKVSAQALGTGNTLSGPFVAHVQISINKLDNLTDALNGGHTNTKNIGVSPAILKVNDNLAKMDKALDDNAKHIDANKDQIPAWEGALTGAAGKWDGLSQNVHGATSKLGEFADAIKSRFAAMQPTMLGGLAGMTLGLKGWGFNFDKIWQGIWQALTAPVSIALHTVEGMATMAQDALAGNWDAVKKDWERSFKQILGDVEQFVGGIRKAVGGLPSWLTGASNLPFFQGAGGARFNGRASGGSISGPFVGAERGPELLLTPGLYNAMPGSYVVNAQQTQQLLSGGGKSGPTYNVTVYGADHNSAMQIAREVHAEVRRRELLNRF